MIIKRKLYSEKKESLYRRYQHWFDKKVDKQREKSRKRIENMKDGSFKDICTDVMDPKKNRLYYVTESERQKGFSELKVGQSRVMLCRDPKTGEKYEVVETWDGKKWVEGKRRDRNNSASFRDADDFSNAVMAAFNKKSGQKNFSEKDIIDSIPKKSRGKGKSKVYKDSDAEDYWPYERYCVQFDDQPGIHDVYVDKKTGKISYKGYNK